MCVCLSARGVEWVGRCLIGLVYVWRGRVECCVPVCQVACECMIAWLSVRAPSVGVGVCAHPWPIPHTAAQRGKPHTPGAQRPLAQLPRFPGRFIFLFYCQAWRQPL